ncbi:MAG: hypothetical protein JW749_12685 [Sedimentisphaerales bacterium]|nr:hypothetical protein [Sedimentisphaerales bacterium]
MTAELDFDSPQFRQCLKAIKEIDVELAYLALLTRRGLKPLSRWERPIDDRGLELLRRMGLITKRIERTVKIGRVISETIFSISSGYIQIYEQRFAGKPVDKSPEVQRFEGFLFGFPPCCVDEYIRHPYAKNNLNPDQQKILFHWACRDCKITPLLLPAYQAIYNLLDNT